MRTSLLTIGAVILLSVAGCNSPAAPPAATTSPKGFAIYLLDPELSPQNLAVAGRLDLADQPLLGVSDIIAYTQATHEIELTSAGYEAVHSLVVPTSGKAFAVCVDGQPIYTGAFWAAYSSQSWDGVTIDPILVTKERPVIRIVLGYPAKSFFSGSDPRSDQRVLQALQQEGKLR